jgi:transposase
MKNQTKKCKPQAESTTIYKVYPNRDQQQILKEWFGTSRWIYNRVLEYINSTPKKFHTVKHLRECFINDSNFKTKNTWVLNTPYDIRDEALNDCLHNLSTNQSKGGRFKLNFQSRKKNNSIAVLSKHWSHKRGDYAKVLGNKVLRCSEVLPQTMKYKCRIKRTPLDEYYLSVPKPLQVRCESQAPQTRVIALDPGVRTFLTGYDINGNIIEIGKNDISLLARLLHYKNKLQSKMSKTNHKHRYKMHQAWLRIIKRIDNLVTDFHRRVSKWLCENYTNILIPKLVFHSFDKTTSRKQRAKMVVFRHCEFVKCLLNKQREYPWCRVKVVSETYTSKTCTNCGYLKQNLYSSKDFVCDRCHIHIDRDANGARNILLKHLTELEKKSR